MKNKSLFFILFFALGIIILSGCTNPENRNDFANATKDGDIPNKLDNDANIEDVKNTSSTVKNKTGEEPIAGNETGDNAVAENKTQSEEEKTGLEMVPEIEDNCIGFLIGAPDEMENIKLIGAGWTRPHPGPFVWDYIEKNKGEYDFSYPDEYVKAAQEKNIAILATVWPFAVWDQEGYPSCKVGDSDIFNPRGKDEFDGLPRYRCKPKDMPAYKEFLKKLVERYDGDGIDDMPGLAMPVKYFEILNEPEMKSEELTFFVGDENDYFELLKESYETIRETCPDCKVLHGGCAGSQDEFLSFWNSVFTLGGGEYFDIANIHYIGSGDEASLNVKPFKEILEQNNLEKPIWVTEVEFNNANSDVITMSRGAFDAGAAKLFYVSFEVGGHGPSQIGQYSPKYIQAVGLCKNK